MSKEYVLRRDQIHYKWDKSLPPTVEVESGDSVVFDTQEVSDGQVTPGCASDILSHLDFSHIYPLGGPVFVKDARPGDILKVEILEMQTKTWGWTGFIPGLGLLPEDFPETYIKHWDLSDHATTELKPGILIPQQPFCGVMGVAPDSESPMDVLPPGKFGGNLDIRHLNKGCTLYLPVWVQGGLFSAGDCHAAQGDGEVCVTGIECPMDFTLRFSVIKGRSIPMPQFSIPHPPQPKYDAWGYFATTHVGPDLMTNAKQAIRYMIDHLKENYGLTAQEAFLLCSVAVDLKISEIVDAPNWIVSAYLPLSIFRHPA